MDFINQKCYPKDSGNVIKEQLKYDDMLYIVTFDGYIYKLFLFKNNTAPKKEIIENRDATKIYDKLKSFTK